MALSQRTNMTAQDLLKCRCFFRLFLSISMRRSARGPSNRSSISSSMSVCREFPDRSHVATSRPSKASMIRVKTRASIVTVGEAESSFFVRSFWGLPSAHARPLTVFPSLFNERNKIIERAHDACLHQ